MQHEPIQPQQVRGEKTRQKLIDAAIKCLARYSYAGTELGQICDFAEVSRRSRQYYFPTRTSLMLAVWHEIRRRDDVTFDSFKESSRSIHDTVELILESGFQRYKTTQYLADLELKLALRSDKDLQRELGPLMEQKELEVDEWWVALFQELGKPRDEIVTIRHFHVGLLRGIVFEYITRIDRSLLPQLEDHIRVQIHSLLKK